MAIIVYRAAIGGRMDELHRQQDRPLSKRDCIRPTCFVAVIGLTAVGAASWTGCVEREDAPAMKAIDEHAIPHRHRLDLHLADHQQRGGASPMTLIGSRVRPFRIRATTTSLWVAAQNEVHRARETNGLAAIFGIAVDAQYVYWIGQSCQAIRRTSRGSF